MTSTDPPGVTAPLSEHSRVLVAIHTAMRNDSERLMRAVEQLPEGDTASAAALGDAFAAVVGLVHDHHWTEDDVMYPFLLREVDGFEREALRLEDDHVDLDAAMARIGARFRLLAHELGAATWRGTRDHLSSDALAFREVLWSHLEREESIVVPAVDTLDAQEQRSLQRAESKLTSYRHLRLAVPWVLANVSEQQAIALRAGAPRLLGAVNDHVWDRSFHRRLEPLYRHTLKMTR
jgi:Hemerythrin HHE cation binding domain